MKKPRLVGVLQFEWHRRDTVVLNESLEILITQSEAGLSVRINAPVASDEPLVDPRPGLLGSQHSQVSLFGQSVLVSFLLDPFAGRFRILSGETQVGLGT